MTLRGNKVPFNLCFRRFFVAASGEMDFWRALRGCQETCKEATALRVEQWCSLHCSVN